jgi:hypothetical protein
MMEEADSQSAVLVRETLPQILPRRRGVKESIEKADEERSVYRITSGLEN